MNAKHIRMTSRISALLLLAGAYSVNAASGVWTNDASGNWGTSANWLGGTVADGTGNIADFSTINITADRTVTLDAAHTISILNFGDLNLDHNWTLSGANTLTLGVAPLIDVVSQSATISAVIAGTAGLTKTGPGALTLGGATETYTGGTTVNGGTLILDFSAAGSPTSALIPSQTFINSGGTVILNGKSSVTISQVMTNFTCNAGAAVITMNPNSATSLTLALGSINGALANSVVTGGGVVFNGPATIGANNAAVAAAGTITTTMAGQPTESGAFTTGSANHPNQFAWGTVGLYDWASTSLANGSPGASPYTIIGGSQVAGFYQVPTNGPGNALVTNVDLVTQQIPFPGITTNVVSGVGNSVSVRWNSPHAPYLNAGNYQSGGLLITPNMGFVNACMTGSRLVYPMSIFQNNTNAVFVLGGVATSSSEITKLGPGTWFFNPIASNNIPMNYVDANNNLVTVTNLAGAVTNYWFASNNASVFVNDLRLNGGVTVISSANLLGLPTSQVTTPAGSAGTVNLNGGTLMTDLSSMSLVNTAAGNANRPVFLGGNGGGLAAQAGTAMTVGGVVANVTNGAGPLTIGIAPTAANGNVAGVVPGTGGATANPEMDATGAVLLYGVNTYTGGTILYNATLGFTTGGLGTGPISVSGGTLQWGPNTSIDISSQPVLINAAGATLDMNGNTVTLANPINPIANGGTGALTVYSSATNGVLILSAANTYVGATTVTNATLLVNNASGSATGTNVVTVQNGGILGGNGAIAGNVTVQSGGQTLPGTTGATNLFAGNLTYTSGGSANFNLTPSATGGGNDQIILNGTSSILTCGSVSVGIICGLVLDQDNDYVLFKLTGGSASISGSFNSTPVWLGATPIGAGKYSVVVSGKQVLLHNNAPTVPPTVTTTNASPNPVLAFQTLTISATVVPGAGSIDPNTGVTVDLTPIGSSVQPLIFDGTGHYTNSFVVGVNATPGNYKLNIVVQDSNSGAAAGQILLTVGNSATWNGLDFGNNGNWSDGLNWVSTLPPGYGDDVVFAGGAGLAPVLDSSYNVNSVTFSSNAGGFTLDNSGGSVLTIANGITNKSANVQTFNLPVNFGGGSLTLNAASNQLILDGVVSCSDASGLVVTGTNAVTFFGANTYTGNTSIGSGGNLVIGDPGELGAENSGTYAGNITDNGTLTYTSSVPQTLSGTLSGTGALNVTGAGVLTLGGASSGAGGYTGPIVINGNNAEVMLGGDPLAIGQAGSGSGQVTLTNGATFAMNGGSLTTASGTCLNSFLVPTGTTGNLIPMGNGTYSGNVTVHGTLNVNETWQKAAAGGSWTNSDGQINIANNNFYLNIGGNFSFGTAAVHLGSGVYIINAGNTSVGGNTITIGELTGDPGSFITDNTGAAAGRPCIYVVGGRNSSATFQGTIYDDMRGTGITKVGTGSWTLTGSDTYTQPTTVSAGSLIVGPGAFMANCTNIIVAAGALLDVSSYGGLTLAQTNNLGGSGVITGAVTAVGWNVINAGVGAVPGTLSFSNSLAETGPYVTNNFNLSTDPTGVSKTNSMIVVAGDLTLTGTNVVTINPVNGLLGVGTYTLFKYSGNLINEGGVVPAGSLLPNNLVMGGAFVANSDVTLTLSNAQNAVVMTVQPHGQNLTWKGGFTAFVTNITATVTNPAVFVTNIIASVTNYWDVNVSSNWLNAGVITNFLQYDNVTFNDTSTNLNALLTNTLAPGSITVNSTNAYAFSGPGIIAGLTGITKSGTNVLVITNSGVNSYTGGVAINGGTVQIGSASSLGATTNTTTIASGATLDIHGVASVPQAMVVQGSGVGGNGAIVNKGAALSNQGFVGNISLAGDTVFGGTNRWDIYAGTLTGNSHNLAKVGTNIVALTSLGDIGVSNINIQAGSFLVASNTTLGSNNATLYLWSGAGLTLNNCTVTNSKPVALTNATITSSSGTNVYGGTISLNGTGTFTATTPLALNGALGGPGGLLQNGASILTLAGTNTYTGATTISNGAVVLVGTAAIATSANVNLAVAGAQLNVSGLAGSTLTLASGQTLQGIGSVMGNLTSAAGSTVAPGESVPGTLTVTNTATLGGNLIMVLTNGASSKLVATNLVFGGTITVTTNAGMTFAFGNTFQLFGSISTSGAFAITNLPALPAGLGWSNSLASNGKLTVISNSVVLIPTQKAGITGFNIVNGNVVISATNGQTGGTYYLLTTTNVATPLSQWFPVATNVVNTNGGSGAFTFVGTNTVTPGIGQQFYILSNTNN